MPIDEENRNRRIIQSIEKTGFDFEYYVQSKLKDHGWHVIPNRYYIDDVKGIEREIDVIAYKSFTRQNTIFYTAMIISCKKRHNSAWMFLTTPLGEDVNYDLYPVSIVTSDDRLDLLLQKEESLIMKRLKDNKCFSEIYNTDKRVFAYFQVNNENWKPEDSPCIYESIISCIKAAEYESIAHKKYIVHKEGKNYKTLYCFFLLSILDGSMYEVKYNDNGSQTISEIKEIKYHNRHIINKNERFYRVHFITKDLFDDQLNEYDKLASQCTEVFNSLIDEFYINIWDHQHRKQLFYKDFRNDLFWVLYRDFFDYCDAYNLSSNREDFQPSLFYDKTRNMLTIELFTDENFREFVDGLNGNETIKAKIKEKLLKHYRYDGLFEITLSELPF